MEKMTPLTFPPLFPCLSVRVCVCANVLFPTLCCCCRAGVQVCGLRELGHGGPDDGQGAAEERAQAHVLLRHDPPRHPLRRPPRRHQALEKRLRLE